MYSQNKEDEMIHFLSGNKTGVLLEIGANDGKTLSNSLMLIEQGWSAHLVEPSKEVFPLLFDLHKESNLVTCYNVGIGKETGTSIFYESGSLLGTGDKALVSTVKLEEKARFDKSVEYFEKEIQLLTFEDFLRVNNLENQEFHFISIDAEGLDYDILTQINLEHHRTEILCIEYNSDARLAVKMAEYCYMFGFVEKARNAENIIFAK